MRKPVTFCIIRLLCKFSTWAGINPAPTWDVGIDVRQNIFPAMYVDVRIRHIVQTVSVVVGAGFIPARFPTLPV